MVQVSDYFSKMIQIFEKIEMLDIKITYICKYFHVLLRYYFKYIKLFFF